MRYGAHASSDEARPSSGRRTTGNNAVMGRGMGSVAQNVAISMTTNAHLDSGVAIVVINGSKRSGVMTSTSVRHRRRKYINALIAEFIAIT